MTWRKMMSTEIVKKRKTKQIKLKQFEREELGYKRKQTSSPPPSPHSLSLPSTPSRVCISPSQIQKSLTPVTGGGTRRRLASWCASLGSPHPNKSGLWVRCIWPESCVMPRVITVVNNSISRGVGAVYHPWVLGGERILPSFLPSLRRFLGCLVCCCCCRHRCSFWWGQWLFLFSSPGQFAGWYCIILTNSYGSETFAPLPCKLITFPARLVGVILIVFKRNFASPILSHLI